MQLIRRYSTLGEHKIPIAEAQQHMVSICSSVDSLFISLVTMFLVCATSSLAGYVLAKTFCSQRILFAIFIAIAPKQSCPCTHCTYHHVEFTMSGQLSCL